MFQSTILVRLHGVNGVLVINVLLPIHCLAERRGVTCDDLLKGNLNLFTRVSK